MGASRSRAGGPINRSDSRDCEGPLGGTTVGVESLCSTVDN